MTTTKTVKPIVENYWKPSGEAASLTYTPTPRFHEVEYRVGTTTKTFRLAVIESARCRWGALRNELRSAGYTKGW